MASCVYPVALGGHEDDLMVAISTLLKEDGVGAEQLQDRAQAMIKKLGTEAIKTPLQSSRPWQALKRIANEAKPPFRLIATEELDRVLAEKAKAGKPIGNRATKAPRSGSTTHVSIGPQDVIIPKGVFAQDDGSLMPQIQLRQVGTAAKGIIVVTEHEVQPYLASNTISNDGLAFIVLHPTKALQTTAGQLIRFPAQCATTGEPILVSAFMIQKGKQMVQRALPNKLPKVEEVPVSTIKMLVFRDQLPMGWKEFCEAPVKNLISLAKCLQICRAKGCDCELWHPADMADGAMAEPILDIWNRDFLTTSFKKVPPKDAQMFVCAARVQSEAFTKLCNISGTDGLFIEPRTSDGRSHDSTYHTVWLPKAQHKEAIAAKAMSSAPTILVRVQNRYGLKVSMDQASQIHEQFRADTVFLGGAEKTIYTVGPMPWGASRSSLTAVFKTWNGKPSPFRQSASQQTVEAWFGQCKPCIHHQLRWSPWSTVMSLSLGRIQSKTSMHHPRPLRHQFTPGNRCSRPKLRLNHCVQTHGKMLQNDSQATRHQQWHQCSRSPRLRSKLNKGFSKNWTKVTIL